jgi:hypothetical protein
MHAEAPGVERAAIAFSHDGATTRVTVADAVDAEVEVEGRSAMRGRFSYLSY